MERENRNKLFSESNVRAQAIQRAKDDILPLFASKKFEMAPKSQFEFIIKKHQKLLQVEKFFKHKNWLKAKGDLDAEYQYRDRVVSDRVNLQSARIRHLLCNEAIKSNIENLSEKRGDSTSVNRKIMRQREFVKIPEGFDALNLAKSVTRQPASHSGMATLDGNLFVGLSTIFKS